MSDNEIGTSSIMHTSQIRVEGLKTTAVSNFDLNQISQITDLS